MVMQLCFATNNVHKIEEVRAWLNGSMTIKTLHDIGCDEDIPETADTIEGNSQLKAQYVFDRYGIDCFADDSGLEVTALGGQPGVLSARYAGQHGNHAANNEHLLKNLMGVNNRQAQFKTVITLIINKQIWQFTGIVGGQIAHQPRGNMGFGYDPLFIPNGFEQTFAEMTITQKNQFSHRANALKKLVEFLNN
jgi:XTP/dITP diphosphohydrolase